MTATASGRAGFRYLIWEDEMGMTISQPGGGEAGPPGDSAYQIAVANGFVGNEAAWLLSLKAPSPC